MEKLERIHFKNALVQSIFIQQDPKPSDEHNMHNSKLYIEEHASRQQEIHFLRGGVHLDFFVKFDLEIAIDQQTRACDRTFEGVPDSGCPTVPAGQPRPFLVQIMPNYAKTP